MRNKYCLQLESDDQLIISFTRSPIGVSTVKKIYGIRSNNGSRLEDDLSDQKWKSDFKNNSLSPSHWAAGAGGVARKALQVNT